MAKPTDLACVGVFFFSQQETKNFVDVTKRDWCSKDINSMSEWMAKKTNLECVEDAHRYSIQHTHLSKAKLP